MSVADPTSLFCSELEYSHYLFIDCFVARIVWPVISDIVDVSVGSDFESVAWWWLSNKNNPVINVVCTATLWALRKLRSDLYFQGKVWLGVLDLWRRIAMDLDQRKVLSKDAVSALLARNARIAWR
jgi:hypothetical protein